MRFGLIYELQLPRPWDANSEHHLVQQALAEVEVAADDAADARRADRADAVDARPANRGTGQATANGNECQQS